MARSALISRRGPAAEVWEAMERADVALAVLAFSSAV
jgi:hypothetical protein